MNKQTISCDGDTPSGRWAAALNSGGFQIERIPRCPVTFFELVNLYTMVDRGRRIDRRDKPSPPKMPTHLDNEQSLVAAAQAGDSDAFVTLLNQYSRHIYRLGVSITGNHYDTEDVLQEPSLKAYRAIAEFQVKSR